MAYRSSLDPFLLASFVDTLRPRDRVIDLGTGDAFIPRLLARNFSAPRFLGIELQPDMLERGRRAVDAAGCAERIDLLQADIRALSELLPPQSCQVVVSNPPYRSPRSGRLSSGDERAAARHELHGGLEAFLDAAAWLLGDGGRLCIVYLAGRLPELFAEMRARRLEPKRLRCVHGRLGTEAKIVLVEGRKGGGAGLALEAPLFVYDGERFSEEMLGIYRQFGCEPRPERGRRAGG